MANGSGQQYLPGGGNQKAKQWWGIYYGYIAINNDPLATGRVKARVPQVFGTQASGWASPMVPLTFVPQIGAPIAVMFVGGDPSQPVYFGNFAIPAPGTPATVSTEPPADPSVGEIWYNSFAGGGGGGNQMFVWNGQDTGNVTLPTGQVIPNGWVAYNLGTLAIQPGVGLTAPNITGGTITGAQFVATGANGEILVYNGTPTAGNLVLAVSAVAGNDGGTGNTWQAGLTVGESGQPQVRLFQPSGNAAAIEFPIPGDSGWASRSNITATGNSTGGAIGFNGPIDAATHDQIRFAIGSNQADLDGVSPDSAGWLITYQSPSGGQNQHLYGDYSGVAMPVVNRLNAVKPGTGTSPTNPAVNEGWNNATGILSGYSGRARYRVTPENMLEIDVLITASTGAAAGSVIFTLPPLWTPTLPLYWPCAVTVSGVTQAGAAFLSGSSVQIATGSASRISFCQRIPMS